MKVLLFISIFILAFSLSAQAQADVNPICPIVSVTGPAGITSPGEIVSFTVSVEKTSKSIEVQNSELRYKWTVSGGEIVDGQGTPNIKVKFSGDESSTASIEIEGLPASCPNIASESICFPYSSSNELIEEFSGSISNIVNRRSEILIKALKNNPNAQLFVLVGYSLNPGLTGESRKEKELLDLLVKDNGIERNRITIVRAFPETDLIQFWLVPAGGIPPSPKNFP